MRSMICAAVAVSVSDGAFQSVGCIVRNDPPLVDYNNVVGKLIGFVKILCCQQHRRAAFYKIAYCLPHLRPSPWVKPCRWLVKKN
jgi:hypothetical protein